MSFSLSKLTRIFHSEQTSVWAPSEATEAETIVEMEVTTPEPALPQDFTPTVDKTLQHVFQQKTVGNHLAVLHNVLNKAVQM